MGNKKERILFVEDDNIDRMAFERFTVEEDFPYDYTMARSVRESIDILKAEMFDVIVSDYLLGDGTAFDLFDKVKDTPIILVTGAGNQDIAIRAMKAGSYDYLIKDDKCDYLKTLPVTIENTIRRKKTEMELQEYRENLKRLVEERTAKLQEEINERKRVEKERENVLYNMGKRIKELSCMYGVARSVRKRNTLEEVFSDVVSLIPPSWQYPTITCARVRFEGKEYVSETFKETEWNQISDIIINGKRKGTVEVYYMGKCPESSEGPFMKEERNLINGITRALAEAIEHKRAEEALQKALTEVKQYKDRLQAENIYLQDEIKLEHNFEEIISNNAGFKKILRKVERVASTNTTVLILGETGTGKELIARAVHNTSKRRDRPLVKINCATIPATLIESELFGHEKGAFTGAVADRIGRFELADKGTIFLDEIGDLPVELQIKLLRVLQEGELERLGNPNTVTVDVRIITATNRNLENAVESGDFRQDLYYRLNVFPINIPSLRERKDDIPLLVNHFIKKYNAKLGKEIELIPLNVMNSLQAYNWPGNVRELENIIERAIVLTKGPTLQMDELLDQPFSILEHNNNLTTIKEVERFLIHKALKESNWVIEGKYGAAVNLDIPPSTLRTRIKKYAIKRHK